LLLALGIVAASLAVPGRLNTWGYVFALIAVFILLFPDLRPMLDRLQRLKAGPVELVFGLFVEHLKESTRREEKSLEGKSDYFGFPPITETSAEARRLLDKGELKAAFLVLVLEVEQRIRELASMNDLLPRLPLRAQTDELVKRDILPGGVVDIFNQVWVVRNSLVHGTAPKLSDGQLRDLLEVAQRLHHMVHYIPC
jgi:hypothetical protein